MRLVRCYGWKPDNPDKRDYPFRLSVVHLPRQISLRSLCPPVYDQGQLGSCTANAIAAAVEFERKRRHLADFVPSRLFIYWNERDLEGTVNEDAGAMIRDGVKSVHKFGAPPEKEWPYVAAKFRIKPPLQSYTDAKTDLVSEYLRVQQNITAIKTGIAQGYPVIFGFEVFESFEGAEIARTGTLNLPAPGEQNIGGHAVLAIGYDDATQRLLVRNSWGAGWGDKGYFTMPYKYVTDTKLASDFWTIRAIK